MLHRSTPAEWIAHLALVLVVGAAATGCLTTRPSEIARVPPTPWMCFDVRGSDGSLSFCEPTMALCEAHRDALRADAHTQLVHDCAPIAMLHDAIVQAPVPHEPTCFTFQRVDETRDFLCSRSAAQCLEARRMALESAGFDDVSFCCSANPRGDCLLYAR